MNPPSWLDVPADSMFGLANLPYGVFTTADRSARTGVAIGNYVFDVAAATGDSVHATGSLNAFLARGPGGWAALRERITDWLTEERWRPAVEPHLIPRADVTLQLPIEVADYVDFYSSQHHAENLGRLFRPGNPPLTPNWRHVPIGYHGRAGTVRVSGTPVVRPQGQRKSPAESAPTFGPSKRLDLEAEVGFVVGLRSELGQPVPVSAFDQHVFGVCLVNDWSARDLQAWEYVPLGPFLGKSFLTSISPWIVPLAALEAARVPPPVREPEPLPYLRERDPWALDITLAVFVNGTLVSRPPFAGMYWTGAQQLAHLTVNGANVRTGDLYASGAISGPNRNERGSLIELSWNGTDPVELSDGSRRTFLEDGDEVTITATAPGPGGARIGFGEVIGRIYPARSTDSR